jgi:hypothetical protein
MSDARAFHVPRIDRSGLIDIFIQAQTRLFPADTFTPLQKGIDSLHEQTRELGLLPGTRLDSLRRFNVRGRLEFFCCLEQIVERMG